MYKLNKELVIVSTSSDMSSYRGKKIKVIEILPPSNANDYVVEFEDGEGLRVREDEVAEIKPEYLQKGFNTDEFVTYIPTNEKVLISKIDYLYGKVEIAYEDCSQQVVDFDVLRKIELEGDKLNQSQPKNQNGYFATLGLNIGKLVDEKQKAYGDSVTKCYEIMKILLKDYKNDDNTYTIPESLLPQMLLDVRKIDKMNRRFSNPDGDLMGENPFQDDVGYSMLGVRMVDNLK